MIELHDVWKALKKGRTRQWIIAGATVRLPPRRRIALLGAQGSGKSLMLKLMSGLEVPDTGVVRRVGLCSWPLGHSGFLDNTGTFRQNVNFLAHLYGLDSEELASIGQELAGFKIQAGRILKNYNSLERRRIMMALTLAPQFDWYFIDEIVPNSQPDIIEKVETTLASRLSHGSVVWATGDVDLLKEYCDSGIVLDRGKLTFYDTYDRASEAYREIIGAGASS